MCEHPGIHFTAKNDRSLLISFIAKHYRFIERSRPKMDHLFDWVYQSHMRKEAPPHAAIESRRSWVSKKLELNSPVYGTMTIVTVILVHNQSVIIPASTSQPRMIEAQLISTVAEHHHFIERSWPKTIYLFDFMQRSHKRTGAPHQ